ncbi:hypothetical protein ACQEXU_21845 [Vibrio sp. TRT 21S02]|uniref:hypothetical protein n=1 Tax=Vibrio sp. TRT 21S02 TaxID=3418507 RepID=UPI003CF22C55
MFYKVKISKEVTISFLALVLSVFSAGYIVGYHQTGKGFLEGVMASVVASIVFHYTLSYWESKKRQKEVFNVVFPYVRSIISDVNYSLFYASSEQSDPSKVDTMLESDANDLYAFLRSDETLEQLSKFVIGRRYGFSPTNKRELWVVQFTYGVLNQLNQLKPYYYMLDSELLDILTRLENCQFISLVKAQSDEMNVIYSGLLGAPEALELVQELSVWLENKNA